MKSENLKGYLFALIATIAFSNIYIFSKAALNEVHLSQFGMYWFGIGAFLNLVWLFYRKHNRYVRALSKRQIRTLITLGILEIITTSFFFLSIQIIPDPAVTSFMGNLYPVLLTGMGIIFLKERFTAMEAFGAVLALIGAFIVSYQGGTTISEFFIPGAGIVLLNCIFAAIASIVVKINVRDMSPELINTNRSIWLFVFSLLMFIFYRQSFEIPFRAFVNIAIGATLGPFIALLLIYYSFHYIEVSKSSIVQSTKVVFVLVGSIIYFGTFPLLHQLVGGLLTLLGVILISAAKLPYLNRKGKVSQ
ncbi:DMT family transporter [Mangrovibacterium diazotrophicum]|uniref:Putative membrane protein n=1 Tax=Mangrovibacterium diazotrophicum TaxID=1261403 RepID=A0A419VVP6_9BACT|nr:DMT family transporter [Mangrovibacterium diazotrophicum]RKD86181.1 putative membrane protein [Mangrovibacterium diazotrophicum]